MPGFKGHLLFAFLFLILVWFVDSFWFHYLPQEGLWWWLVWSPLILFMSLLPDIDTPASKARRVVMILGLSVIVGLSGWMWYFQTTEFVVFIFLLAVCCLIPWFLKHRGRTHSFGVGVLLGVPLFFLGEVSLFVYGTLAFWSHLLIDWCFTYFKNGHVKIRII